MNIPWRMLTDPQAARLALALLHLVWQGALVAAVLAIALRLLRNRSANARYLASLVAMAAIAAAPIVTFLAVDAPSRDTATATPVTIAPSPVAMPTMPAVVPGRPAPAATAPDSSATIELPPVPPVARPEAPALDWSRRALDAVEPYLPHVVAAWTVGVLLIGLWRLGGWMQVRRLTRLSAAAVPTHLEAAMRRLAARLGVARPVRLLKSALATVPTVIGWWRPVVLLPVAALTGLTPEQIEVVLAHELAHIRRHDYLVNLAQVVVETLLFYHPAVWWVSSRIRDEREHCCDDLALTVSSNRAAYARALERIARLHRGPALALSARGGSLLARIRRILGLRDVERFSPASWLAAALVLVIVGLVFYGCAVARVQDDTAGPRFTDVEMRLGTRPGALSNSTGPFGRTGKLIFGHPGQVSEVTWKYLRTTDEGDVYEMTRRYPSDTDRPEITMITVTYNGVPTVAFEDDVHRAILFPAGAFDALVAELHRSTPRRPRWLVAAEVAEFGGAEAVRHLRDTLKELTPEELASAPSTPERIVEVIRKLEPAGFPTALCSFANFHAVGDRGWTLLEGMDLDRMVSTYVQPFERRQTEQQTREAAYGALAAKDGLDLAWEEEGGNRLLAFGGLKLAPFKLPALPQGYDVWSDGERFLDQRRLVRMVESYNATANVPEVRQGVRAYPFAPGDRFLALLPGDRVGLVRCGEVFHNAQYVYLHFTAKLFDPLYQTVPASAFPDILGDADKATAGSDGVAVEYQMTSTIPVPDAGVTAVSTSATGSLNTGWTAPPKGELEFESFSLQVDGNHRDAQGRPQGMLLDKAGKAIGVYLVVKGDTMRCVREAARDRRHGDRPVALLLPDADRDTVEQAWSVLREFCGDRAVLLVPGKLPSDVRLLAHAEHAAGDPQKSLAATDAFPDSDLRGRWECERDGVKATIELYSDGQATWRIEMRQYTIVSSLALVDEPQTGTIALRADYTVGATRENKSTVIGRLERTPSGELAASVLPAAKELNSSYRVVSQIPLRRTGPATWRKEAAVTDLRPSGAEPGQGSWRIAPVQPVELRLHEFSVDELSGAASWGGDYLRRKIAEPVDLMGTVEVNSDRLLWHSSLARTDQPQPKLEFCDADYPGSGIGTPTIGVSSAPRLLTPQCRVLWAVQWRDSAGRLLKTAGCLARVTEPRPDDEAPPGPTDEEIREALRLWADDGRNSPEAVARQRFLAVERFARLPADEQAEQLPQFYRDVAPGSINRVFESILSSVPTNILDRDPARGFAGNTMAWARQLADASAELTPEQVADKLDNILWLRIATRARAVQVLMKHVARTETLIREDLASREAARVDRGCGAFDALQLPALVEPLLEMFLADDALSEAAGRALLWVDDPAVCARLMERVDKDASFLARCAGKLQGGLYRKPAGPVLLRLLESADAEVRYNAGRAVYECTDPNLVGPAAKFARDAEPRFRVMAAYLGSNLPAASFASARADLLPLLSDPDEEVRLQGLRCFAQQKDLAAGPTILDFLRGSHTGPAGQREVTVMQSLAALTGEQFGYDMHHWGADAPGNQEAIRRFEAWLSAAKAKASGGEVEVLPAEVKPEASLSVQLVNPQGQALEKQSLVMVPVSTGYSEAIEKSFFWADKSGKVIVKELAPGKHRFVVNAQWPHPTFAEFDAPEEGGETRLTVRPRSDDALPDLDVKVQQRTEDDKILLDVTVTNNTDAAYTLTDTDLQLVSIRHRVFPPLPQQPAAVIVPPRGKGESKFTLDWNRYVKLGQWCSRNGEDISWPGPTEDDQHMYYRVQVGITGSLPIPMPKPGEKRAGGPALQFRIAPSPTDLDEAELASCRDWLKAGRVGFWWKDGRAAGMAGDAGMGGRMPRHAWLPIAGDVRDTPQLVTGEHDGQKYLLVSDRPGETMSSAAQGPDAWRLTRVAAETGEAGRPRVRFDLDDRGAALMSALTQVNLNRAMAVIV
ncbi:MAG: M48 family metalloprotease, partial [Planctomycetes bacterium]|nr:M48 family metalloprotease [Planctomycetota bacterium]